VRLVGTYPRSKPREAMLNVLYALKPIISRVFAKNRPRLKCVFIAETLILDDQLSKLRGEDARSEDGADGGGVYVGRADIPSATLLLPSVGEELPRGGVSIFLSSSSVSSRGREVL
jgi:hypothetical protein